MSNFADYVAYRDSKRRMFEEANPVPAESADDSDDRSLDGFRGLDGSIDWEAVYDSGICDDCDEIDDLYELCELDDSVACDDDVPF